MDKTILILLIIFGTIGISHYMRYRFRMFEMRLNAEKEVSGDLKTELEEIRQRLAALEKIVTDKGYQLNEEFEELARGKRKP